MAENQKNGSPPLPHRRNGRAPKLTDDIQRKIVQLVQAGNFLETAALASGISERTLHRWMSNGEDIYDPQSGELLQRAKPIYRQFRQAITHARAEAEAKNVLQVTLAGGTDWKASAWYLERSRPAVWGRRDALTVKNEGEVHHRVTHEFGRRIMGDATAARAASEILAVLAGVGDLVGDPGRDRLVVQQRALDAGQTPPDPVAASVSGGDEEDP